MSLKLVSIIIPIYNSSLTLPETINSVLRQDYSSWECFLVDDCSSDNSLALCNHYANQDCRFTVLQQSVNSGVAAARNCALSLVNGEYIVFLDADDYWHDKFLSKAVSALLRNQRFVYAPYKRFLDTAARPSFSRNVPPSIDFRFLLLNNHLPLFVSLFEASLLKGLRFTSQRPEDYIFWLKLFSRNKGLVATRIPGEPLGFYRVSPSQRSANKFKNIKRVFFVYRDVLVCSFPSSLLRSLAYVIYSLYDYIFQFFSFLSRSLTLKLMRVR